MDKKYVATTGNPLVNNVPIPPNYAPSAPAQNVVQPFEVVIENQFPSDMHYNYTVVDQREENTSVPEFIQAEVSGLKMVRDEANGGVIANQRAARVAASIEASVDATQRPNFHIPIESNPHREKKPESKIHIPKEYVSSNDYRPDPPLMQQKGGYDVKEYDVSDYEISEYKSIYD